MKKGMLLLVWLLSSCGSSDDPCQPATCADLGYNCGTWDDGCGSALYCGGCTSLEVCNAQGQCECAPYTCDGIGRECGTWGDDGCGGVLDCGGCPAGEACDLWGQCQCAPGTCADFGYECGTWDDGCGNNLDCGGCPAGETCNVQGQCEAGDITFTSIVAGSSQTCALTSDGTAWCWGYNNYGQLGVGGTDTEAQSPVAVDTTTMTGELAYVELAGGNSHTCGLTAEGAAWCWGYDFFGQLGDGGDANNSRVPVPVDVSSLPGENAFTHLTGGGDHTCGLTAEGLAWCWGCDLRGELGDGGVSESSQIPVAVNIDGMTGDTTFSQIVGGYRHTCGLTAEGIAWCWGEGSVGQLGDGGTSGSCQVPVPVDVTGMTGETAFVQLTAGNAHTCGLTAVGSAWCWGDDYYGQLGNGGVSSNALIPAPVDVSGMTGETAFVKIDAGGLHTCGLTAKGAIWCWGDNFFGQLGEGGNSDSYQDPVQVNATGMSDEATFIQITGGFAHTCGLTAKGAAWCWGRDYVGQLGNGEASSTQQIFPAPVDISDMTGQTAFAYLTAGSGHTCGFTADGAGWCWGMDAFGQLGDGGTFSSSDVPVSVEVSSMTGETAFFKIAAGADHTCGLTAEGAGWSWGSDVHGQLGDGGGTSASRVPVSIDVTGMAGETAFVNLTGGNFHTCGLTADGSAWCWGYDSCGQLGDGGDSNESMVPVPVDTTGMTGATAFVQIDGGQQHTCGLTAEGFIWCWGYDLYGQLGDGGTSSNSQVPVVVNTTSMTGETTFIQVTLGVLHTCGLTAGGNAWCWGYDDDGQLGDGGTPIHSQIPVAVVTTGMSGETSFSHLVAGSNHTCALTAEGRAWCWGSNVFGQLGDGGGSNDSSQAPVPVDTSGMTDETAFVWIVGGGSHTCGLTAAGAAWCWGNNLHGQLGDGITPISSQVPVRVASPP